jgi:ATP-dependent protease HslVU (ClpYQ) peptidase subunit
LDKVDTIPPLPHNVWEQYKQDTKGMSTIITAIRDNTIHMIADTGGTYGTGCQHHINKIYDGGDHLVSVVGNRDPYLTMYHDFTLPPATVGAPRKDYIAGPLRNSLKPVLSHIDAKEEYGIHLAFYYSGEPCLIDINGNVHCVEDVTYKGWVCEGSGKEVAMGVMDTLWDTDMNPRAMLEKAINASSRYDAYTALPSVDLCLTA